MENKNTIIALVLMLLVWTGFTYIFPPQTADTGNIEQVVKGETPINVVVSDEIVGNLSPDILSDTFVADATIQQEVKTFVVENDKFIATFSTEGGRIISLKLKDYRIDNDLNSEFVSVIDKKNNVPSTSISSTGNLLLHDKIIYNANSLNDIVVTNDQVIKFTATTPSGLFITKVYQITPDNYDIKYELHLENVANNILTGQVQFSLCSFWDDSMEGNRLEFIGPVSFSNDELFTDDVEDISEENKIYKELVQWSGFENKYFISSIIVSDNTDLEKLTISRDSKSVINSFGFLPVTLSTSESKVYNLTFYYGPKDFTILKAVGSNLSEAIDFGFFKILAKPLHIVLNFFYSYVGNYGVAIILLTVILKLIFWPLTQKSYVSMKAMQTLQPEMKRLREKFRNDKEGLNRKMMELYKEHRVNPLGGCLPMFVQIPVFFALYKVLLDTIELRHAPFIFWITDLSIKDPYYITPLVMGLTMFIQQRLTPSTMDPMQAKMMMAMPVVFTFMFLNFPAGLVIYWLVNNLLTIFQQYLIYKKPA